jgi:hypothetical protein
LTPINFKAAKYYKKVPTQPFNFTMNDCIDIATSNLAGHIHASAPKTLSYIEISKDQLDAVYSFFVEDKLKFNAYYVSVSATNGKILRSTSIQNDMESNPGSNEWPENDERRTFQADELAKIDNMDKSQMVLM